MISYILLVCGFVFYYLSYKSPKTDLILYGISGIFFMLAALAGFLGYGDIPTGETIVYNYTSINNETLIANQITIPTYSGNIIFTSAVPIIEFLIGLYILIALGVDPSKQNDTRREK